MISRIFSSIKNEKRNLTKNIRQIIVLKLFCFDGKIMKICLKKFCIIATISRKEWFVTTIHQQFIIFFRKLDCMKSNGLVMIVLKILGNQKVVLVVIVRKNFWNSITKEWKNGVQLQNTSKLIWRNFSKSEKPEFTIFFFSEKIYTTYLRIQREKSLISTSANAPIVIKNLPTNILVKDMWRVSTMVKKIIIVTFVKRVLPEEITWKII